MKLNDLCFEIIKACPNQCLFCSSCSSPNANEIISLELYKKTIDRFMELGVIEELSISGGEPLLHPNIIEIINYAKNLGIKVILYTSGICKMVNNNYSGIPREIIDILKAIGLDKIVFDLQTINEDNYNYLMGTKNFLPYVLQSIARVTVVGIPAEIHFIPLKTNQNDLKDILEIAELGIERVRLLRFIPQGRGLENANDLMLSNEEISNFIANIHNYNFKIDIREGVHLLEEDTHKCTAGLGKFVIRYDGKLLPCPAFKDCDEETLRACGLKDININSDDDYEIKFSNGTRVKPLCKQLKRTELK